MQRTEPRTRNVWKIFDWWPIKSKEEIFLALFEWNKLKARQTSQASIEHLHGNYSCGQPARVNIALKSYKTRAAFSPGSSGPIYIFYFIDYLPVFIKSSFFPTMFSCTSEKFHAEFCGTVTVSGSVCYVSIKCVISAIFGGQNQTNNQTTLVT